MSSLQLHEACLYLADAHDGPFPDAEEIRLAEGFAITSAVHRLLDGFELPSGEKRERVLRDMLQIGRVLRKRLAGYGGTVAVAKVRTQSS